MILGNSGVVMEDIPSASMAITSVYFFWKWLKRPEMLEVFIAGIILGLAELTKFTLLIFYPLFVAMWLLYRLPEIKTLTKNHWFQQFKQLVVMFAMSLLIINMGYLFERTGKLLGSYRFQTTLFTGYQTLADIPTSGGNRFEKTPLAYLPMPFPSNFIQGIDTQRLDFERGLPSYLRGKWSKHGWYALSVNHLYNREKQSRYFLNFEPVATAGYSIYIYHITMEDANRVRHEMGLPEIEGITSEQNQ